MHIAMDMKHFLRNHLFLIILYSMLLFPGIVILFLFSKEQIHLFLNKLNSPFFDFFFKYVTQFGAFLLIAPIIVAMAFFKIRYAMIAIASSLLATIIVQILKRIIWVDSPRPKVVFQDLADLHYVEGVRIHSSHSFPSGHTAGAFALFIVLALINKRPVCQFLFLMTALLVGYSRMYLSQHFLIDVVVGSLVGTISAVTCYLWLKNDKPNGRKYMDRSLIYYLKLSKH